MKTFVTTLLLLMASVLVCVPVGVSQVAGGGEPGVEAFSPFGKHGQILAQATCTALRPNGGFMFAVKRHCDGARFTCAELCRDLTEQQAGTLRCYGGLHVYANPFFTQSETLGLKTHLYTVCDSEACGPNYCCCGN